MTRYKDWNRIVQEAHDNYTTQVDEVDANTTYVGKALIGTPTSTDQWQIKKVSVSGTVTTIGFAGGTDAYANIWDSRVGLSYS